MSVRQVSYYAQYEEIAIGRVGGSSAPSTPAARSRLHSEMHLGVYTVFFATWAAFFSLFWLTFSGSPPTVFLMGAILAFALIGFGLPIVMNRTGKYLPGTRGTLGDFLRGRVATIDGSVTGMEALIQVVLVPACLTVGGVAIAYIIDASRFSY